MLAPALFMLQVYDRVLSSRSNETLIMLLVLVVGALLFMAYLDMIRSRLLTAAAVTLEKRLGPEVLDKMIRRGASPGRGEASHGLRDVNTLRAFLTGPGIIAIFDAPWVPIFVIIIFLFHPWLGILAFFGAVLLFALAIANEWFSRPPLEAMQLDSRLAGRFAEQSIVNAEVARVLGMEGGLARGWGGSAERASKNSCRRVGRGARSPAQRASSARPCRS